MLGDRDARLVLALVVLAAALRFGTLDAKGYWQDEAQTALLLRHGFLDMLGRLPDLRGAPPLYYLVARGWSALFGTGEVGLRSFSALLGVAAVPVAYLSGRELISGRAGLLAATLVATNPLLVWYGQEARAYAMLVLLAGLAFLFFARALGDGNRRDLSLWAISSVLATATNYFALFPFLAEAAWLLRAGRLPVPKRAVRTPLAVAGVLIVSLALLEGTLTSRGAWIQGVSLFSRIVEIPGILLVGFETPAPYVVAGLAGVLAAVGLWLVVARGSARERRGASIAAVVGGMAVVLPTVLALVGVDYLLYRSVLAAALPLAVLLGAGLGAARAGYLGAAAAGGLVAISLAVVALTAWEPKYHRDDWRSAARAAGPATTPRVVAATPGSPGWNPLEYYLAATRPLPRRGAAVREVDVMMLPHRPTGALADARLPLDRPPPPPVAGERLVERRRGKHYLLFRYRSPEPTLVTRADLRARRLGLGEPVMLFQPAG